MSHVVTKQPVGKPPDYDTVMKEGSGVPPPIKPDEELKIEDDPEVAPNEEPDTVVDYTCSIDKGSFCCISCSAVYCQYVPWKKDTSEGEQ